MKEGEKRDEAPYKARRADRVQTVTLGLVISAIGLGYTLWRDARKEIMERIQHCEQAGLANRESLERHKLIPAHQTQGERYKVLKERVDACCPYGRFK